MALPPFWKIVRELRRLINKTNALPSRLYGQFFATPVHDIFQRRHIERFDGVIHRGDRVAIYLVFPEKGLLPSHKLTIEHLKASGYAPYVISNLPLNEPDRAWLTANSYKFLTRPNIGYDFGGYREGILSLADELKHLRYVAFFNDSTWFPTAGSKSWLPQAEALDVAYASAASSYGIPHVNFADFRNIEWKVDVNLKNFHYCSYALLIRQEILCSKSFWRFWTSLPLTAEKNLVVRLGEIGLTKCILRNGFSHGCTYDLSSLPCMLEERSDTEINEISRNLITLGNPEARKLVENVVPTLDSERSKSEREDLIKIILTVAGRIGVSYVLPDFLYKHHGFSFLKKSPLALDERDSGIMLDFGRTLPDTEGRVIEAEMEQIRQSKG